MAIKLLVEDRLCVLNPYRREVPLKLCEHRSGILMVQAIVKAIPTRRTDLGAIAIMTQEDISGVRANRNAGMGR